MSQKSLIHFLTALGFKRELTWHDEIQRVKYTTGVSRLQIHSLDTTKHQNAVLKQLTRRCPKVDVSPCHITALDKGHPSGSPFAHKPGERNRAVLPSVTSLAPPGTVDICHCGGLYRGIARCFMYFECCRCACGCAPGFVLFRGTEERDVLTRGPRFCFARGAYIDPEDPLSDLHDLFRSRSRDSVQPKVDGNFSTI